MKNKDEVKKLLSRKYETGQIGWHQAIEMAYDFGIEQAEEKVRQAVWSDWIDDEDQNLPIEVLKEISACLRRLEGLYSNMTHDCNEALIKPLEYLLNANGVNLDESDL
ncbi:hypothetical protein GCM10023149_48840 [Mucilaginibacter gynuensis]|uniref:Uncharacterized protein n=1 Tax=Mucilaginibacter gynuensis TaxID=1302236 RepID=A0ABP8HFT9_9SPHI